MRPLIVLLALSSIAAFAQAPQGEAGGDNFESRKKMALEHIEKKIGFLNEMKSCVSSAADQAALKTCHEKMREHHKEMKMEHMDQKIQKLQERKAKMGNK